MASVVVPESRMLNRRAQFYTWAAVVVLAIIVLGFARSYYLKGVFGSPPLSAALHLHGFIMTSWFVLFLVQVRLIASGRTDLHRRVGILGIGVATLVVITGAITAINAAALGRTPGPPALDFLAIPLGDIVIFPALVIAGILFRHRSDFHKRLMLLASMSILSAATFRIPFVLTAENGLNLSFILTDLIILACIAYDSVKHRSLHPAFLWGFVLILAGQILRFQLMGTALWNDFATWLVN